jgi:MarR family transcriptional regulator, temperature-dependent positive regulator of motility
MSRVSLDRPPYIGAMLRVVSNWVRDEVYDGVVTEGHVDLAPAHLALFRYPGLDGTRPSELAEELQISRQAINQLVGHLETCGYVERERDPADGRARVIRLTESGRSVEGAVHGQARGVEERIAEILGARGFVRLRSELERLFHEVTDPDETPDPGADGPAAVRREVK